MYLKLLNLVHKLKGEKKIYFIHGNPYTPFAMAMLRKAISESIPLNFCIHPCASYFSICEEWQCQSSSTCKI